MHMPHCPHLVPVTLMAACVLTGRLPAQIHVPLEPPYRFAIYDARPYGGSGLPALTLTIQSVRDYPTLQYRIRADLSIRGDTITVELREIVNDSPIQQDAMGPAVYSTSLSIGTGAYDLALATSSAQDRYRVGIAGDAIDVSGPAGMITIPPSRLYRIPHNSAYVHCTPAEFTDQACRDFLKLASIRAHISTAGNIPLHRPDPFFYPLPMGRVEDSLPQAIYLGVDSLAWVTLVHFAEDYTRIFQYAQYTLVVGLYNWDGVMAQCWSGVCHGIKP